MSNSPIKEGNEWRFDKNNQPKRMPTLKQQSKQIEGLLVMPLEEVKNIALSANTPVFLRFAAEKIIEGEMTQVIGLIAEYKKANKKGEVMQYAKR